MTPPSLTLVTIPGAVPTRNDGGSVIWDDPVGGPAFRRDEDLRVEVSWGGATDVDAGSVFLYAQGPLAAGGNSPFSDAGISGCAVGCGAGCKCFLVNLGVPPLEASSGQLNLLTTGSDLSGNFAPPLTVSRRVTRFKFTLDAGLPTRGALALDRTGNLYVGTDSDVRSFTSNAVNRWVSTNLMGRPVGAVAVAQGDGGSDRIYGATDTGAFFALRTNTGAVADLCQLPGPSLTAPVLVDLPTFNGTATPMGFTLSLDAGVVVGAYLRPIDNPAGGPCPAPITIGPVAGALSNPTTNMIAVNGNVFALNPNPAGVHGYLWNQTDSSMTLLNLFPMSLGGSPPFALAGEAARNRVVGVGAHVWDSPITAGASDTTSRYNVAGGYSFTSVVVASAAPLMGRTGSAGIAGYVLLSGTTLGTNVTFSGNPAVFATPIFGEDNRWYVPQGMPGPVIAFNTALSGIYPVTTATDDTAPNLDCNREHPGRGGVLYLRSGMAISAWIIDARGPSSSAPWPRFQHDALNSGNANTTMSTSICP